MTERLGTAELKSGQTAELVVVTAPEPGDPVGIRPLLGHKGGNWQAHIDLALAGETEGLETRWYLALLDGVAVSNVMTIEYAGAGILGHVFTYEHQRRKGLCQAIFDVLQPHFLARGGKRLILGTGYDSAPYWIYWRAGWRPLEPASGFMDWQPVEGFAAGWYRADSLHAVPYAWRHWPALAMLFTDDFGDGLQLYGRGFFGLANFEGPGLELRCNPEARVQVLENASGVALALASLTPDRRWPGITNLDLIGHPCCDAKLPELLAALPAVEGKVQCWLPGKATARRAALEASGYRWEAALEGQLSGGEDVVAYARS